MENHQEELPTFHSLPSLLPYQKKWKMGENGDEIPFPSPLALSCYVAIWGELSGSLNSPTVWLEMLRNPVGPDQDTLNLVQIGQLGPVHLVFKIETMQ